MKREEIKQFLPHREPMLLVDEINVISDENGMPVAHGIYHVTGEEFFLKGHFPEHPVVPGVIICEIMGQTSSILMKEELIGRTPFFISIDNVRFKRPITPNETMCIKAHIANKRAQIYFVEAEVRVARELCAQGKLTFALVNN